MLCLSADVDAGLVIRAGGIRALMPFSNGELAARPEVRLLGDPTARYPLKRGDHPV